MKIKKLTLDNFMAFGNAQIDWSDNIKEFLLDLVIGRRIMQMFLLSVVRKTENTM